jgi:hypothetical protein
MNEVEKLQYVLFSDQEINAFKLIPEPLLLNENDGKLIYKKYSNYEFFKDSEKIKKRKLEYFFNLDDQTIFFQKINNLI